MSSSYGTPAEELQAKAPAWRQVLRAVTGIREGSLLLFILVAALFLSLTNANFLTVDNFLVILSGLAMDAVIAVGMTLVMISGGIDLSVGSVFACAGVVLAKLINLGAPWPVAVLAALLVSAGWGVLSGTLITRVGVNPLISTLGVMGMARGVVYVITTGQVISNLPDSFKTLGQGEILGIAKLIWVAVIIVIIGDFLARRSRVLRQLFYVGGSEKAARLSGININRAKMGVYILIAFLCGVAGVLETSRFGSASSLAGAGKELTAISACVIGGASLSGGEGSVVGSFLGLILLGLVGDGLILNDVSVYWQGLIRAVILVMAVAFDVWTRRRRRA
jgi:ribose transport system permease protein